MLNGPTEEDSGEMIEQWVNEEGADLDGITSTLPCETTDRDSTHIYNEEHGPPADLRTQIFHRDLRAVSYARILQQSLVRKRLVVALQR